MAKNELDTRFTKFGTVSFAGVTQVNDFIGHLEDGKLMGTRCKKCGKQYKKEPLILVKLFFDKQIQKHAEKHGTEYRKHPAQKLGIKRKIDRHLYACRAVSVLKCETLKTVL